MSPNINDIAEAIQSELGLFADDTKIFSIIKSIWDVTKLQRDLINMQEWNGIWLLNLNLEKCKMMMHVAKSTGANYTMETLGSTVELTKTDFEKDLGVWVTSSLKPSLHCDKAAAAATRILGMLKRTFTKFSKELFIFLYKTYVRPQLEYCVQLWCPYLAQDIDTLENVQRWATKLVNELVKLPYESRLRKFGLYSLYCRRQRGDLIEVYKLLHGYYDVNWSRFFTLSSVYHTRGHHLKLFKKPSRLLLRSNFFTQRVQHQQSLLSKQVLIIIGVT